MRYARRLYAWFLPSLLSAFCLLALAATPVQAEGNWTINGTTLKAITNWEMDSGVYGFLLPSLNMELVFGKMTLLSGELTAEGKGAAKFELSEGKVYTISPKLEEIAACGVGNLVFTATSNLFLHSGKTYNALALSTTTTYWGEECPLAGENKVLGTVVLEDPEGFEKGATTHLMRVAPAGLFPTLKLIFGAQALTFDGSFVLSLAGAHAGSKWSGVG